MSERPPDPAAPWTTAKGTGRLPLAFALALLSYAMFGALVIALQFARTDLDWMHATLSLYLHGPWGLLLRSAYCLLALAIVLMATAVYRSQPRSLRSAAPVLLFSAAAVGLAGVAVGDSYLPEQAPLLAPLVHGLSAQTAFLCVTVAMLLQASLFRADPAWAPLHARSWWLAWCVFAALWANVLWRELPRGGSQKLVIAGVLAWLVMVAWQGCRRVPQPVAAGHNAGIPTHRKQPDDRAL